MEITKTELQKLIKDAITEALNSNKRRKTEGYSNPKTNLRGKAYELRKELYKLKPNNYSIAVVTNNSIDLSNLEHVNDSTGERYSVKPFDPNSDAQALVAIVPFKLYSMIMHTYDPDEFGDEIDAFNAAFEDDYVIGDNRCFIAYINLEKPELVCYDAFNSGHYTDVNLTFDNFADLAKAIIDRFNK